jgi:cysteine desulfurase
MSGIYLDHAATTPTRPEVVSAMLPYLGSSFGNPSSMHAYGQAAKAALDRSRDSLAEAIGAEPSEITFTGSGTEADNLALIGTVLAASPGRRHIITSAVEHDAILNTVKSLAKLGCAATILPVDQLGFVSADLIAATIRDDTLLVSIMHANNEVGTIQPIREIAEIAHNRGVLFHTDAVQSFGQLPVDVDDLDVDLLTLSAHKIYGPKGVGALYIRRGTPIDPAISGGGQERGRRSGTENVAGIVGFAEAVKLLLPERSRTALQMATLRDYLIDQVLGSITGCFLNGPSGDLRLPNNANFSFENIEGEALLLNLDIAGIAASSGSACSSGSIEPSHVLIAMGLETGKSRGAVRLTLGRNTSLAEIETCIEVLRATALRLRQMNKHSLTAAYSANVFC